MTRPPAPALTAEEARTVARFDAAPVPPEVVAAGERVETVARALAEADGVLWNSLSEKIGTCDHYRIRAAAAIAALPPSPAEEAVKALVRDLERGRHPGAAADLVAFVVRRLSAALASPAPAPQGEEAGR